MAMEDDTWRTPGFGTATQDLTTDLRKSFEAYQDYVMMEGKSVRCSAWQMFDEPSCIIVAFTRTSGNRPLQYGSAGMFRRAQRAAEAFAELYNERSPILLAIPRQATTSRAIFFDEQHRNVGSPALAELWRVLDAAKAGRDVYLLSVGVDGFSTQIANYVAIAENYSHLNITVVLVVQTTCAGSEEVFQTASTGIRYGIIPIATIKLAVEGVVQSQKALEFIEICEKLNSANFK